MRTMETWSGAESIGRRAQLVTGLVLFSAVVLLVVYPPALALIQHGTLGAFKFFAPDSFYYLSIAERSQGLAFFSFDGQYPTNGFHPLWGMLLAKTTELFSLDGDGLVRLAALAGISSVGLGAGLFAYAAWRWTGRAGIALLAAVPGFFWILMPAIKIGWGSPWSFANGMESPLSVGLFGLLCCLLWIAFDGKRPASRKDLLGVSWVLALIALARLDDIFLVGVFVLAPLLDGERPMRERIERAVLLGAIPAVLISGYMLYNLTHAGSLLPSSGMAKSQPLWAFARNAYATWTTFFPGMDFMRSGADVWASEAWRVLQMLVPAGVAILWLLRRWSARVEGAIAAADPMAVVDLFAAYVIIKAGYNFTMVSLWSQGDWYYPISIMVTNLIVAIWITELLDGFRARSPRESLGLLGRLPTKELAFAAAIGLALVQANLIVDKSEHGLYHELSHRFWSEREVIRASLAEVCDGCGVVAYEDGVVSFSLYPTPTLNGLGLAVDDDAAAAIASGGLLELAWARGHHFLVTVNYPMPEEAYTDPSSLLTHLRANPHLRRESLAEWDFEVVYRADVSGVAFIRFEPREAAQLSAAD
ncbi:MAG: hypothetical protein JRG92_15795 [Deltaproteobacteria bacterium]|nr:hypothetical protein [Deltaproteobacteria bacterium]